MKRTATTAKKIIFAVLLIIVLVVLVGSIVALTKPKSPKSPITLNGETINNGAEISLLKKSNLKFETTAGYKVRIVANSDAKDFDYIWNDKYMSFKENNDYTDFFDIETDESIFTLTISKRLKDYLSALHLGAEITVPDNLPIEDTPYFSLVVETSGGTYTFPLYANLYGYVESVTLDKGYLVL